MAKSNKADAKAAAARKAQTRANDQAAKKGLAALTRSVLNGGRKQKGSVHRGLVVVVAGLGLAGWGWAHGSSAPDGRWLLAVVIVAAGLALIVVAGRRYVQHDRADAAYTKDIEKRVRQDRTGAHYQDGA